MRTRTIITFIVLFLLTTMSISHAQVTSDPYNFQLSEDHELSGVVTSKLVWAEDQDQTIGLNLTMSDYRVNNSEITIRYIQIYTIETGDQANPELKSTNATEFTLTVSNPSVFIEEQISPPRAADRFYLNITINAAPSGGGVAENYQDYFLRFPEEDTIIIEQDNLVPVINLYGFPQSSFFQLWLPIYGISVFMLALPALIVGVNKLRQYNTEDKKEEPEETLDEEEEDYE